MIKKGYWMQRVEPTSTQKHVRGEPDRSSRDPRTNVWSSPARRVTFSDPTIGSGVTAGFVVEWELPALGNPDEP
jgi:hypothetical protein